MNNEDVFDHEIAIIGKAGRFPGANTVDEFWHNLREEAESITFFSDQELLSSGVDHADLNAPNYVKAKGYLEGTEFFDASFFGYSPREAEIMDPQQRLFLEAAWHALENAGYDSDSYPGLIGVYAGVNMNSYLLSNLFANRSLRTSIDDFQLALGNDKDYLTTRVSYKLNLKGPSVNVQTACSTSLVAVHMACQSLLNGECDIALAGGVSISVPQKRGYFYQEEGVMSPDGHCRAFDAKAAGTVQGNGVGIVVLKRLTDALADGDSIHAIIKGSAINNDGALKVGFTAPSIDGQANVIAEALALANIDVKTISYIETHGTGTALGDPIEIAALAKVFQARTEAKGFCAIGSVKSNVGHLDAAAGVTGLIKTVLALEHCLLPPSLHFEQPNPKIDFANSPFFVNTRLTEWKKGTTPHRAGVSSFGVGGTNAHVVLEEAPDIQPSSPSKPWQLLVLSAKTHTALDTATANLAEFLKEQPNLELADVAYTCQVGRKSFDHRRMLVCYDMKDAIHALQTKSAQQVFTCIQEYKKRPVVFLFPGQGTQYVNMARDLYRSEPVFRERMDHCIELFKPHLRFDLRELLYPSKEQTEEVTWQLNQTELAQPALFIIEYALATMWMKWGIQPQAMLGHSVGEYVAACLAGVFSLQDAVSLVAARGRLMQQLPTGAMLSVSLPAETLYPLLGEHLSLAAINGPTLSVVSGSAEAITSLQNRFIAQGVDCHRLHTSHAFHSAMMDPILQRFAQYLTKVVLKPPTIPYISNVTGTWISEKDATDPTYWIRQLRQTVHFSAGVRVLLQETKGVLLEVGPGQTLGSLVRQHSNGHNGPIVFASLRHPQEQRSDRAFLLETLGNLWLTGVQINWHELYAGETRHRLPLPPYPFERQRYWITPEEQLSQACEEPALEQGQNEVRRAIATASSFRLRPNLPNAYVAPDSEIEQRIATIWQNILGIEQIGIHDNFLALGGHSLLATQLISRLRDAFSVELSLHRIFAAPTIAQLAEVVEEQILEKIEEAQI